MKLQQLMDVMETIAPAWLAEDFDNSGLQCGNAEQEVNRILLSLDCTDAVIDEADELGADCIVTHHPLIWQPLKCVDESNRVSHLVRRLIKRDIALFAAHTNLDSAQGGICDVLAKLFGLQDAEVLLPADGEGNGYARKGYIAPMTVEQLADKARQVLDAGYVRYSGDGTRVVDTVAVASGSGSSAFDAALEAGVQCMISGDIRYDNGLDYTAMGMALIDAGHFATENIILPELQRRLQNALDTLQYSVDLRIAHASQDAFRLVE